MSTDRVYVEFPGFADLPTIPEDWIDESRKPDGLPSWSTLPREDGSFHMIWIGYQGWGETRFVVDVVDRDGNIEEEWATDDWSEVLSLVVPGYSNEKSG